MHGRKRVVALALFLTVGANALQKVAVIGATGKVGRLAVQQLVSQGITARVLLRSIPGGAPSS